MKKIAFIANSAFTFGGEQRVLCMIANALAASFEITIYSPDTENDKRNNPFHLSKDVKVVYFKNKSAFLDWNLRKTVRVLNRKTGCMDTAKKARFMCDMYYPPEIRNRLAERLKEEKFDFVIGIAGYNSMLLGLIAEQIPGHTIGWMHNSYEAYFETPALYYWNQFEMFRYSVSKLDRCFVLNEYIAGKYKENLGIDCEVFYNPRSFCSKEKAALDNKIFIACGEFNYRKGFDYLIEAFHIFSQKNDDWKLVILGDGEKRSVIEDKIRTYHLENRIILKGNVKNVNEQMLQASAFLLSSRWEGFPMVGTEALEVGLPTIAFDITAMQPLVTNGVEGILVPAYDCTAFADAMLKMAQDSILRKKMGQHAAEKSPEFSIEKITLQWIKILEEM